MWYRFPEGVGAISVQQQVYQSEFKDKDGRDLFRAPAHFANEILRNKGFEALADPPAGAPEDLVPPDPVRDGAITDLAAKTTFLENALSDERTSTSALRAELGAALHERDQLKLQVHELTQEIEGLKSDAEEKVEQTPSRKRL